MITVYSKEGCPFCDRAKQLLETYGMEYKERRIDIDSRARDFVVGNGHRTVPQLYVGEDLLVEGGFDGLKAVPEETLKSIVEHMSASK